MSVHPDKRLFFSYTTQPIFANPRLAYIRTEAKNVEILAALLNSVVTLLYVELSGTSRNLGALDLNATFMKTRVRILDPALLSTTQKAEILKHFKPLSERPIEGYDTEYKKRDRIAFDKAILTAFGYDTNVLSRLYTLLTDIISNRVELKER